MPFGQRFLGKAEPLAPNSTGWIQPTLGPKDTGYLTPGRKTINKKGDPKAAQLRLKTYLSTRGLL